MHFKLDEDYNDGYRGGTMKKLLAIILLLITTSLSAEWSWVEIPATSPPIINRKNDGDLSNFRVGYDPQSQSIILNLKAPDNQLESWRFDGKNWTYMSECFVGEYNNGEVIYNPNKQKLYDFINSIGPWWNNEIIIGQLNGNEWLDTGRLSGYIYDITYDSVRQSFVILELFANHQDLLFYDGAEQERIFIPIEAGEPKLIEYDPIQDLHLLFSGANWLKFAWEYKDGAFYLPDVLFPYDPDTCLDYSLSLVYFPPSEGILVYTQGGCTLLWKDQEWTIYKHMNWDNYLLFSLDSTMVYFPPTQEMFLFIPHPTTQEMKVFRFRERAHIRPFNR